MSTRQLKKASILFFICAGLMTSSVAPAQDKPAGDNTQLNVRDFGAKGDRKTDDTEAIQAAFDQAQKPPYTPVFFPPGAYLISNTITMFMQDLDFKRVSIIQENPAKDIFYVTHAWQMHIRGITFVGGAVQLNLGNNNIDQGFVRIEDCIFKNSEDVAIKMSRKSTSTRLIIRGCKFTGCEQVLDTLCDMTTLADAWITTKLSMTNKAVIVNRGVLRCENILGVPSPNQKRDANQRWIDNYGSLQCVNFRFGGEGGGFPAVVNWTARGHITITDSCLFCAHNGEFNGAIFFEEVPAFLTVRNCSGSTGSLLIGVSKKIDLDTYFDDKDKSRFLRPVQISLDRPFGWGTGLPEQLMPYIVGENAYEHVGLAPPEGFTEPKKGWWWRGQFVRNPNRDTRVNVLPSGKDDIGKPKNKAADEPYGWYCLESGKPGKWTPVRFKMIAGR